MGNMLENYTGMWNWGVFLWVAIALVIGVVLTLLVKRFRERNIKTTWYDWLLGIVGMLLLLFTIQNFYTSFLEFEPQAGWMFVLVTGIPSLVLLGVPTLQVWRRNKAV